MENQACTRGSDAYLIKFANFVKDHIDLTTFEILRLWETSEVTVLWVDAHLDPQYFKHLIPVENPYILMWVDSFVQFTDWILDNGVPTFVCLNFELHTDCYSKGNGLDCLQWLKTYCNTHAIKFPICIAHANSKWQNFQLNKFIQYANI